MFKRKNTVQLEITYKELQMLRRYLLIWRNKLLAQGHITDSVDEQLSNWAEKRIDLHTSAAACAMADVLLSGRRVENEKACNLRHSGSSDCHWCIALALVAKVEQHPVHYGQGVVMRIT